jgi:hypothetical protein
MRIVFSFASIFELALADTRHLNDGYKVVPRLNMLIGGKLPIPVVLPPVLLFYDNDPIQISWLG